MIEIRLEDGDRIESALKAFKKKVQKAGVLKDLRKKRHYLKPSEAKLAKKKAARQRGRGRSRSS